jgi:methyltransferase
VIAAGALAVVLLLMLVELSISRRNERLLRGVGAIEPPDPVYTVMRIVYPGLFVLMAVEGGLPSAFDSRVAGAGVIVLVAGKLLKAWAIRTLGDRWTYRVLVLPGAQLVTGGPYRWMRHPNYVGVIAELVGFALLVGARWTGPVAVLIFGELLRRRIRAEEQALGLSR